MQCIWYLSEVLSLVVLCAITKLNQTELVAGERERGRGPGLPLPGRPGDPDSGGGRAHAVRPAGRGGRHPAVPQHCGRRQASPRQELVRDSYPMIVTTVTSESNYASFLQVLHFRCDEI